MPNFCNNVARFYGNLEKVKEAFNSDKLFQSLVPTEDDIDSHIALWGTKWEATTISMVENEDHISICFDTAWEPPIEFYQNLPDNIFVEGEYFEPGMMFCGYFHKDRGDSRMDLILDPDWIKTNVNQEIIDSFDLVNYVEELNNQ
jgi:hypothetical protein